MAITETSIRPPHKRPFRRSRPDDEEAPLFAPIPNDSQKTNSVTFTKPASHDEDHSAEEANSDSPDFLPQELSFLNKSYSLAEMSIKSQSKINQKVSTLLEHMSRFSFGDLQAKPGVIALHAKAPVANKLISVIEIAKREITTEKGKLYQYSNLGGELVLLKAKPDKAQVNENGIENARTLGSAQVQAHSTVGESDVPQDQDEDSEPAFETMKSNGASTREKIRAIPTLTIYLSRVPIKELRDRFGEQTNV